MSKIEYCGRRNIVIPLSPQLIFCLILLKFEQKYIVTFIKLITRSVDCETIQYTISYWNKFINNIKYKKDNVKIN